MRGGAFFEKGGTPIKPHRAYPHPEETIFKTGYK